MNRIDVNKYIVSKKVDLDTWPLVKSMIKEWGLARQHIDSYNHFIERGIKEVIEEQKSFTIQTPFGEIKYEIEDVKIGEPEVTDFYGNTIKVTPSICRLRGLSYSASIKVTFVRYRNGQREYTHEELEIGKIPVMLKSKKCRLYGKSREELISLGEDPDDPGGYFIINGSERCIVALEDLASNSILTKIEKSGTTNLYTAKILSVRGSLRTQVVVTLKKNDITVTVPFIKVPISFSLLMKALGFENEQEIAKAVSSKPEILDVIGPSLEKWAGILTSDEAITYIGNRAAYGQTKEQRYRKVLIIMDKYLFPHVGIGPGYRRRKGYLLGEMVRRVAELYLGWRKQDDRDHYANKRLRLAGPLLSQILAKALKQFLKDLRYQVERYYAEGGTRISLQALARPSKITNRLNSAMATGTWSQRTTGVTQILDRTNFLSTLSHLRRVQSPLSRTRPQFEARELHASHLGRICPVESPEGQNIGLVKNLALSALVSREYPADLILERIRDLGLIDIEEADDETRENGAKVFLNGDLVGFITNPEEFVNILRELRRRSEETNIPPDLGIVILHDNDPLIQTEIYIESSGARVLRPLIVVKNGKPLLNKEHIRLVREGVLTFSQLVKKGIIELIDAFEEYNTYIAFSSKELTKEHTHLELSPYLFLGVTASIIPFAEHNQSPRNSYEAAMAKQALGIPYINSKYRVDSRGHLLVYPQLPIVQTKAMEILGINDRPVGQNLVIAILSYGSYNMEDAVVINKAAVERGMLRSLYFRTYTAEVRRYAGGLEDRLGIPTPDVKNYAGEQMYRHLDEDGLARIGSKVKKNEVLVGRTSPPRFMEEFRRITYGTLKRRDSSIALEQFNAYVDRIVLTVGKEGELLVYVKTREDRIPELGDKLASRHGQKGVIGLLAPPEDLPYTADGIVPDLIINPHAFPSRMTVGQFLESIAGKFGALGGRFIDGTSFVSFNYDELAEMLGKLGFEPMGTEVMYDGHTGRRLKAHVFIGIVYYQKLHHMVADKIHARARGSVTLLTRQPTEGRSRGGGLRIGDMEKDTFVAYGASAVIKERLLESSDKTTILVCKDCGMEGYYNPRTKKYVCPVHGEDAALVPITVAYAFKLLLDELRSLLIYPRIKVKEVI
jgi:DNA-directed RNA polymerase subunit B